MKIQDKCQTRQGETVCWDSRDEPGHMATLFMRIKLYIRKFYVEL